MAVVAKNQRGAQDRGVPAAPAWATEPPVWGEPISWQHLRKQLEEWDRKRVYRYAYPDGSKYETTWQSESAAKAWANINGHRYLGEVRTEPPIEGTPRDLGSRGTDPSLSPPPLVQAQTSPLPPTVKKKLPPTSTSVPTPSASAPAPIIVVPWQRQNKEIEESKFALRNPEIAGAIGAFLSGTVNITTIAARLAVRSGLDNTRPGPGEGTEVNALRHATWQAMIADAFGQGVAEQVANAHEEFPDILAGIKDLAGVSFVTLSHADTAADTMNNKIGRSIALSNPKLDPKRFALEVLKYFHTTGLWVASRNPNGTFSIVQTKLSASRYQASVKALQPLDPAGFNASELTNIRQERERRENKEPGTRF